ncbi:MAG: hypothetical protein R3C14_32020 [Caldilineaceae bacterium]
MNSTTTIRTVTENCHEQEERTALSAGNQFIARVLELTNQERRRHGVRPPDP